MKHNNVLVVVVRFLLIAWCISGSAFVRSKPMTPEEFRNRIKSAILVSSTKDSKNTITTISQKFLQSLTSTATELGNDATPEQKEELQTRENAFKGLYGTLYEEQDPENNIEKSKIETAKVNKPTTHIGKALDPMLSKNYDTAWLLLTNSNTIDSIIANKNVRKNWAVKTEFIPLLFFSAKDYAHNYTYEYLTFDNDLELLLVKPDNQEKLTELQALQTQVQELWNGMEAKYRKALLDLTGGPQFLLTTLIQQEIDRVEEALKKPIDFPLHLAELDNDSLTLKQIVHTP